jgi:predicted PurR-regulated permease PerM
LNTWTQAPWVKVLILAVTLVLAMVVIYGLREVLTPFFVALTLAYLLDPVVQGLERLQLPRGAACVVVLLGVAGIITALMLVIYPAASLQLEILISEIPHYIATLQEWLTPLIKRVSQMDPGRISNLLQEVLQRFEGLPLQILQTLSGLVVSTLATLGGILTLTLNLLVIPVATFYFLRDFSRMREAFPTFLPVSYRQWVMDKLAEIDRLLSSFVHGQLMVALILMGLYSIGLTIIGTPSSVMFGILTGTANILPFMGLLVGLLPATILTFLRYHDWQHPVGVVAVFAVVQLIEANLVTPKIVGERLGLHPVVVLLSVLVGGEIFGFLGILLAVPTTAVIKVFWRDVLAFYRAL